ncbi:hypothetical protein CICLE_v10015053mg [Citrus x clementina]|uniref:CRAL-TRIO domain-containing protein n=1 Tax=Citrus clementina TaxID=85681 RepID=V4UIE1_CITCL|nr:patellin-4 [Citrus x clementina]ESR62076.1 hypothetical protein CICLE_v10015053mg [Citrus x clementina]
MTVEVVKVEEETQKVDGVAATKEEPKTVTKCSSYKEESNFLSDLKDFERKALNEFKAKLEEAILGKSLLNKEEETIKKNEKAAAGGVVEKEKEAEKPVDEEAEQEEDKNPKEQIAQEVEKEAEKEEEKNEAEGEEKCVEVDKDIALWGVPLLPSKGAEGIDVILLKFLRAREFKVNDALEMLKNTLQWRKGNNIDSILDEDLEVDLSSAAYMNGVDREGHPVCYNIYGVFESDELYQKTFGTEEKRGQFLRWRLRLMEQGIQKLDFKPGGISSLLQINDLKNAPVLAKKELRVATKQAVDLLQNNYPEFVARNIIINAPFWYYALNALISPFLTQRTKSKFVVARPAKVTEILLKYIPAEELPVQYGGFKRENDFEFSKEGGAVSEITLKAGSTETIEIQAPEIGTTITWDLTVLGWEVSYKEEFVPTDEGSYTIIVQKGKKMGSHEGPIRNTFKNNEAGKLVLTIDNASSKKKRVLYRYKTKNFSS